MTHRYVPLPKEELSFISLVNDAPLDKAFIDAATKADATRLASMVKETHKPSFDDGTNIDIRKKAREKLKKLIFGFEINPSRQPVDPVDISDFMLPDYEIALSENK